MSRTCYNAHHIGRALRPELHLGPKASLCYSKEALPGCDKGWDMIFGSIGLTGGCSTGIGFEVGSTTLLSPPGGRKAFG